MNSTDLEHYNQLFIEEFGEQLQIMDEELLRLERERSSEHSIQSLFRAAHTIKGSSAAMGYEGVKQLTHEMEQVLDGVRNHQLAVTRDLVDLLFMCQDSLKTMRDQLFHGQEPSVGIESQLDALKQAASPEQKQWRIQLKIHSTSEMKLARCIIVHNKLQELARNISCTPSLDEQLEDAQYENITFVCTSNLSAAQLEEYLIALMDVEQVEVSEATHEASPRPSVVQREVSSDEPATVTNKRKTQSSIRVNVERLEQLMNLVGELVIDQTRIHEVKGKLLRKNQSDEDTEELANVADHMSRVVADLQELTMKVRMVPIEQLFNRFPRMVRDLGQSLGKDIELTLAGSETELDRSLIEEIGDPLIHLIRNAMDHGIEDPETRRRNGKPPKGQLRIAADHEDNQIVISVEDDGAGIDAEKIRRAAIQKGVISAEEADKLSDQEAIHLIFHAGFSTASAVSEVSGRGVGMDIVRSDIERLNGLIDIETIEGQGTRFKIRLPLTLAIITGLLTKISDRTFILPMGNVAEIIRVSPEEIKSVRGDEVIMNRDRVIPILWLHDRFQLPKKARHKGDTPLVIVGTAEKRVALAVDELLGNQDIVIKSLGAFVGKPEAISGATILGDGRVAFILEVADILKYKRG